MLLALVLPFALPLLASRPALAARPPVLPGEPAPATVSSPDDVHLAFTSGLQWRLGASAVAGQFRERWGSSWIRWDERNATPHFLGLSGVPQRQADALLADIARLARVDPAELTLTDTRKHALPASPPRLAGNRTLLHYERRHNGLVVEHDEVLLVVTDGQIGAAWVRLTPFAGLDSALPGQRIVPMPDGHAVVAFRVATPDLVTYIDSLGATLWAYDPRRYFDLSVEYEPVTVGDALVTGPARGVTMTDSSGATAVTATDGSHSLSGDLDAWLDSDSLAVLDNGEDIHVAGNDDFTINQTEVTPAAADVLHHFYVVQDWLRLMWPTHDWLDDRVPATVRIRGVCNAYYTSGTINFYAEGGGCVDLGRIADVVYHEFGHGIHEYIVASGTVAGDIGEGSADFTAATILDNTVIGNGAWGPGTYFREIETDKFYPDDTTGEVHNDGLIWASFLWNLREAWRVAYTDEIGIPMVDALFLGTLEQGPTLTDLHGAVIVADDDDGDFTNGTPHACELEALLAYHGLGPGPIGEIGFDHTPLGPQGSATAEYPVSFDLYSITPDCSGLDGDSVKLWFTADASLGVPGTLVPPEAPTDTAVDSDTGDSGLDTSGPDSARPPRETGSPDSGDSADSADSGADTGPSGPEIAGYDGWTQVALTASGITFSGAIPRQAATSHVRYFMEASSFPDSEGVIESVQTHGGDPEAVYAFWVGDRHAIWCEGFEAGFGDMTHSAGVPGAPDTTGTYTDQWETGVPVVSDWDPDSAVEGTAIAATALGGIYLPNNQQYLESPALDLSTAGPMLLFHQSRWLTVEDAKYDHADLTANGVRLYSNARSRRGSTATLDTAWVTQDIDLVDALGSSTDLTAVTFDWGLTTDQGLEFGGWALDDVCVYDLDDVPGHYRTRDLVASDDAPTITVTWQNPWMTPLAHVVLVRKSGGYPADPVDGEVIVDDPAPVIGASMQYEDAAVEAGSTWYYTVFAAAEGDLWQGGVVEGQNADMGSTPAVDTDTGDTDTADTDTENDSQQGGDSEATDTGDGTKTGCGCASEPGGSPGWIGAGLILAGLGRRRRGR